MVLIQENMLCMHLCSYSHTDTIHTQLCKPDFSVFEKILKNIQVTGYSCSALAAD